MDGRRVLSSTGSTQVYFTRLSSKKVGVGWHGRLPSIRKGARKPYFTGTELPVSRSPSRLAFNRVREPRRSVSVTWLLLKSEAFLSLTE